MDETVDEENNVWRKWKEEEHREDKKGEKRERNC